MTRPNLLLFMPDQLRADALGAFGSAAARTPHLDMLAAEGVRFADAYSQHSVCSQSRISMFTGWYPHVAGHRTLSHLLRSHEPNVFRRLHESGYHVAMAGARGDLLAPGVIGASADRWGFTRPPSLDDVIRWHRSPHDEASRWYYAHYHGPVEGDLFEIDAATVATALDWLADDLPEPWCLFVPLVYPHPPFVVERRWYDRIDPADIPPPVPADFDHRPRFHRAIHDRYGLDRLAPPDWIELRRTYLAMVARVDDQLGQLRRAVEAAGCADRTVTVAFTDHGEYLGDYGLVEKWMSGVEDPLVHNPLIIHDPAAASGVASGFVELVDLTATLEDYAGLEPAYTHFGRSLRPVLADPATPHRDAAFSEGGYTVAEEPLMERGTGGAYRHKQDLQHEDPSLAGRVIAVRTERWTYVERLYEPPELYDRGDDPAEATNLAPALAASPADPTDAVDAERRAAMADGHHRIHRWLFETSDVIPWDADPRVDPDTAPTFA